jgi:hypothetical protein
MICPHCQKEMPENYGAAYCPYCGRDLLPIQNSTAGLLKAKWLVFFAVLLAPAVLSLIGIALNIGSLMVFATFGGSLIAGKICSAILDEEHGYSTAARWLVAAGLAAVSFFLCFGGCMAGVMMSKH